jgi:ABC-type multidrug transport system ATPase subunit
MKIVLENVGRRFNQEWIFRGINWEFVPGNSYAVLGPNGSGKSTFLSLVLSNLLPSEGKIGYFNPGEISVDDIYKSISYAAPYLDLVEEFTLQETIDFHFKFKKTKNGMSQSAVLELLGLSKSQDKALKYFSSGMKQRTKLVLAFCSDTPILLLDEPTSNLDAQGIAWYNHLVEAFGHGRIIIVCSNEPEEYEFCNHFIHIADYK